MILPGLGWTYRLWWRDRRLPAVLTLLLIFGALSVGLDALRADAVERTRQAAELLDAATFEGQGARNPHSVAHFSRVAFRPRLTSAILDTGISDYAGTSVWLEAHVQDPANSRPAEDRLDLGRFVDLDLAWVGQVLAPLLVLMLGFDAFAGQRQRRNLQLLVVNGAPIGGLVRQRAMALFAAVPGTFALLAIGAQLLHRDGAVAAPDVGFRLAIWLVAYGAYLAAWVGATLFISLVARSSRTALLALLAAWTASVLVAPRLSATMADELAPIPPAMTLRMAMARDIEQGADGKAQEQAFETRIFAEYGVSRKEDLEVSWAGLSLREGELVGNRVYDEHYGALARRYAEQRRLRRLTSFLGPLIALQHVSSAAAGTDVDHHIDFTRQAETQRRSIVGALNDDMVQNGAHADFDYLAAPALWKQIPTFRYSTPALGATSWGGDFALLGVWAIALFLALLVASHALQRNLTA